MSKSSSELLVAVIGTTGVGKSQLAIELAEHLAQRSAGGGPSSHLGCEIINADAMQCYRGLDIATNKVTPDEMRGIPHHLMSFLDIHDTDYHVGEWQREAVRKVESMHARNVLPIAVGGTTYYLQNLMFPDQLAAETTGTRSSATKANALSKSEVSAFDASLRDAILQLPGELLDLFLIHPTLPNMSKPDEFPPDFPIESLPLPFRSPEAFTRAVYEILQKTDPNNAERWHWRDVRKVRRGLEIVAGGRRWQDVLDAQAALPARARYKTLVLWPFASKDALEPRLDARVDKMLQSGLMDDLRTMWRAANPGPAPAANDYSTGIFQTIGYKEFSPLLRKLHGTEGPIDRQDPLFTEAVEQMKVSTRQYAKRQIKWIKSKLLPAIASLPPGEVSIYLLDATDISRWTKRVHEPACRLADAFVHGQAMPEANDVTPLAIEHLSVPDVQPVRKVKCDVCTQDESEPFLVDEVHWDKHTKSKKHKRLARGDVTVWIEEQKARGRANKQRVES